MKLKSLLTQLAAAAALSAVAAAAHADTYQFAITGDYTATFQLQSTVASDDSSDGIGFVLYDTAFASSSTGLADVYFWHTDIGGGLQIDDYYADTTLLSTDGPQLYTGAESNPTFLLGTFALTEYQGTGTYTLTVTNLTAAVPEPASIALMLGGLGLVGVAAARRRKTEEVEA